MNHIEFYEKLINNFDLEFETRHYLRIFNEMNFDKAYAAIKEIHMLMELKKHDVDVLKSAEKGS
jgi:hypothetical protein